MLLVKNCFEIYVLSQSLISSFNFRPKSEINQFVEIALLILSLEISESIEEVLETFGEIEYQKYEKEGMVSNFILNRNMKLQSKACKLYEKVLKNTFIS